jgi:hypothetical protein
MTAIAFGDTGPLVESAGVFLTPVTVKDAEQIPAAVLVARDANGEAVNAADAADLVVLGRSEENVDNTADGKTIKVKRGCFWAQNNGNITAAHIGTNATVVDNQTVGLPADTTNDVVAGKILDVDAANGVLIDTQFA